MKILLIGDACIDCFIGVSCDRISPERPVPIVKPVSLESNPGMAGNVMANLMALAPDLDIVTLFPDKPSTKTRYVDKASNQHFLRVDQDVESLPLDAKKFLDALEANSFDAVVMSDYAKGFLNPDNMKAIALLCENRKLPTFLDTKCVLGEWSKSITVVKINAKEYAAQLTAGVTEPWKECENLIVTRGGDGIDLYSRNGSIVHHSKSLGGDVVDVVGAGDTVLAALVVGYLETTYLPAAMDFAMKAAAVAVSKRGVVAVKREEIL